jgi:hypothetical protein
MVVARELAAVWWRPTDPTEAGAVRCLFDVVAYRSKTMKVSLAGALAFVFIGLCTTAFAVEATFADGRSPALMVVTAVGFTFIATGVLSGLALRRLRRAGLLGNGVGTAGHLAAGTPPPPVAALRARLTEPALNETVTFARPRLVRAAVLTGSIGGAGLIALASGLIPGVLLVAAAVAIVIRFARSSARIGPDGVVDHGILRTRRWSWDEVCRITTPSDDDWNALLVVDRQGRSRPLVQRNAVRWPQDTLERFAEAATGLARAPEPERRGRRR